MIIILSSKNSFIAEQGWEALKTWGQAAALAPSLGDISTGKVIYGTTMRKDNVSKHVALSSSLYGGEHCILWLARFYETKNVRSVHRKSCQKWGLVSLVWMWTISRANEFPALLGQR